MRATPPSATPIDPVPHVQGRPDWWWLRLAALAVAPVALITGLAGGLWRLGWDVPDGARLAALHGPLMISGLFGTVIGLERAVAFGKGFAYTAPILSGLGTLALLAGAPPWFGATFYLAAAGFLAIVSGLIVRVQPAVFTVVLLLGALSWGIGSALWLAGEAIPAVVGWWLAFLVLTIGGERLEMSRLLPPRRGSQVLFVISVALIGAGACIGFADDTGGRIYGLGLLACTIWLLRHDIARRNIRMKGAPRYFAICMLAGYAWLGISGGLMVVLPSSTAAFRYDMVLHAVLIGFVLSMVFGHALIILPAVIRLRIGYSPLLYVPLAILHGSLAMRMAGGLGEWSLSRQWSGIATALAIVTFAAALIRGAAASRRNIGGEQAAARKPVP
ncbi:hypothetical protein [Bradyrhizobium sp.]|uniref:hypothetical protein n=1 Tax=Bradyrhizobium sp. TaxID=376 RepID=UPI001E0DCA0B|nr:hypothetical protein [Bradyrhizobium sp.]MBI5321189.1 hypothetical protein [Bradyrhizobium sp.]